MRKVVVFSLVLLGLSAQGFAQDVIYSEKIKKEDVPAAIIESVAQDYPDFTIEEMAAIPVEYVESDVYVNRDIKSIDDYDTFEITLEGKGKEFTATYDRSGNLISTNEHLKNIAPPAAVRSAIAKAYIRRIDKQVLGFIIVLIIEHLVLRSALLLICIMNSPWVDSYFLYSNQSVVVEIK